MFTHSQLTYISWTLISIPIHQLCMQLLHCAGLAICYRCPIGIRLSTACLKMMSGWPVSLDDFEEVDPELYRSLHAIQAASEEDLRAMDLTFESPSGTPFEKQQGEMDVTCCQLTCPQDE